MSAPDDYAVNISLYEGRRYQDTRFVRLMTLANLSFAFGALASWPLLGPYIADPLATVTGGVSDPHQSAFEYPFLALWVMPLTGVAGAYIAKTLDHPGLARVLSAYPLLLTLTCCVYLYFFAPSFG